MNPLYFVFLSLIGFAASFYIYNSKRNAQQVFCPIGHDCDAVIKSRYGKTFGIENTIGGMLYYLLVFSYGLSSFLNRNIFKENLLYYFVVIASACAVLFSVYLTAVQAFVLKKWCDYCITSSIISELQKKAKTSLQKRISPNWANNLSTPPVKFGMLINRD